MTSAGRHAGYGGELGGGVGEESEGRGLKRRIKEEEDRVGMG